MHSVCMPGTQSTYAVCFESLRSLLGRGLTDALTVLEERMRREGHPLAGGLKYVPFDFKKESKRKGGDVLQTVERIAVSVGRLPPSVSCYTIEDCSGRTAGAYGKGYWLLLISACIAANVSNRNCRGHCGHSHAICRRRNSSRSCCCFVHRRRHCARRGRQ